MGIPIADLRMYNYPNDNIRLSDINSLSVRHGGFMSMHKYFRKLQELPLDRLVHIDEGTLFSRASELARQNDKELSLNTLKFFMRFISLSQWDSESWFVAETSNDISVAVDMPQRTVSFCLKCLKECGVLSSKRGKPTIWRIAASVFGTHEIFP